MADIRPFQALLYDPAKAGDAGALVAPPYDKISPELAAELHARSPHNCVRLVLGEGALDPADPEGRYHRSARTLAEWRAEGILRQSLSPCVYAYRQEYELEGAPRDRLSLVVAGRLHPFADGVVKPHERTHRGPKADRLELMRATRASFGQILMLYRDPDQVVRGLLEDSWSRENAAGRTPLHDLRDDQGARNTFLPLPDAELHARLHAFFADRPLYIADGHHRYETAVAYRDEVVTGDDPDAAPRFGQWTLMAMEDPGLHVYATHRLLCMGTAVPRAELLPQLESNFEVEPIEGDPAAAVATASPGTLVLLLPDGGAPLSLRTSVAGRATLAARLPGVSEVVRALDVTALHTLVIEGIYGVDREAQSEHDTIQFLRDPADGLRRLRSGEGIALALLQPTSPADVLACADAGDVMPQKSTDFFPKVLAGLSFLDLAPGQRIADPSR